MPRVVKAIEGMTMVYGDVGFVHPTHGAMKPRHGWGTCEART